MNILGFLNTLIVGLYTTFYWKFYIGDSLLLGILNHIKALGTLPAHEHAHTWGRGGSSSQHSHLYLNKKMKEGEKYRVNL